MIKFSTAYSPLRSRRGYTVIIVLLILTILAILAITLSYTTRLEAVSASNYTSGIQARTAAVTGVAFMSSKLTPYTSVEAPMLATNRNFWSAPRNATVDAEMVNTRSGDRSQQQLDFTVPPISDLYTEDTSALLNLNTATERQLTFVIQSALNKRGLPHTQAATLAKALAEWRLGPDGAPGLRGHDDDADASPDSIGDLTDRGIINRNGANESRRDLRAVRSGTAYTFADDIDNDGDGEIDEFGELIDEPDEFIADIRIEAHGDDRRVYLLSDLNFVPGFTPEIIEAITPYVTVFSESRDVYIDRSNREQPRVNINTADLDELYDVLAGHFSSADPELIAQFVVNIADYRDTGSVPTIHEFQVSGKATAVYGVEVTPFINEVWPDSISSDDKEDDDGQYVEIINPWTVPLDVDGWVLKTATSDVVLKGKIAPRGFIIITDDLDDSADPTPEDDDEREYGSFYSIFGLVPNSSNFRMVEHSTFDLPNNEDTVRLYDKTGNLIDEFYYNTGGEEALRYSWQREDPRLRSSILAPCTPYMVTKGFSKLIGDFETDDRRDRPFHSLAHALNVTAGYVRDDSSRSIAHAGLYPLFEAAPGPGYIDWSILDLFTIDTGDDVASLASGDNYPLPLAPSVKSRPAGTVHGRVNVNTASPDVLKFLFDIDIDSLLFDSTRGAQNEGIVSWRPAVLENPNGQGSQTVQRAFFSNRSEFFAAVMAPELKRQTARQDIINALDRLLPEITLGSMSYSVLSQNRQVAEHTSERSQALSLMKAIVSLDDAGQMQIINWHFVH